MWGECVGGIDGGGDDEEKRTVGGGNVESLK